MFGLEYLAGAITVLTTLGMAIVWAIPVNFIWQKIGSIYFNFLPEVWLNIPYWHIVGLSVLASFIGMIITKIVPTISKTSVNNGNSKEVE